jgi:hypothetical protein
MPHFTAGLSFQLSKLPKGTLGYDRDVDSHHVREMSADGARSGSSA